MSSPRAELAELAYRVADGAAEGTLSSERAVQLRAVEPLLEVLGWDVRGPEVVPETTLGGLEVDYLLTIGGTLVVPVGTAGPNVDLEGNVVDPLERAIVGGHAARAIATNGRSIVLLAAGDNGVHRRSFRFAELPDHADALGQFHRSVIEANGAGDRADRRAAARRLAEHREAVVEAVTSEIVAVADEPVEEIVADEAARAVDSVVDALGSGDAGDPGRGNSGTTGGGAAGTAVESPPDGAPDGTGTAAGTSTDATATEARGERDPTGDHTDPGSSPAETGGEYVVRFFGGSSSVGAVGTDSPHGTTVGTVRYLLENHDLARSITLPWRDETGTTVVAGERIGEDWTTLSNASGDAIGVRPIDDPARAQQVIDTLVEAAGLRAMFQGDW